MTRINTMAELVNLPRGAVIDLSGTAWRKTGDVSFETTQANQCIGVDASTFRGAIAEGLVTLTVDQPVPAINPNVRTPMGWDTLISEVPDDTPTAAPMVDTTRVAQAIADWTNSDDTDVNGLWARLGDLGVQRPTTRVTLTVVVDTENGGCVCASLTPTAADRVSAISCTSDGCINDDLPF